MSCPCPDPFGLGRGLSLECFDMMFQKRKVEMSICIASFLQAVCLSYAGMMLSPEHDIAAGVCMVIAQFLLLCASIIGIDYKLNNFGSANKT